jgi:hypothetical protein
MKEIYKLYVNGAKFAKADSVSELVRMAARDQPAGGFNGAELRVTKSTKSKGVATQVEEV